MAVLSFSLKRHLSPRALEELVFRVIPGGGWLGAQFLKEAERLPKAGAQGSLRACRWGRCLVHNPIGSQVDSCLVPRLQEAT